MSFSAAARQSGGRADKWAVLGLVLGVLFFLGNAAIAYVNIANVQEAETEVRSTHSVITTLDDVLNAALDAETGQRGFMLTGREAYLEPYTSGLAMIDEKLDELARLTADDAAQRENIVVLRSRVDARLAILAQGVEVRRSGTMQQASEFVGNDRGKAAMDAIRAQIARMSETEQEARERRMAQMAAAWQTAIIGAIVTSLSGILLVIAVFVLFVRNLRARQRQEWLQTAQNDLSRAMMGDRSLADLSQAILAFLHERVAAQAGVLFKGEAGHFRRVATQGVPGDADIPDSFVREEGLLGQVAVDARPIVLRDVPPGYLTIGSALGRDNPRHLVIAPATADGQVNAVIELGFFEPVDDLVLQFLDETAGAIGIALRSARFRERLQDALEETQRQAGELQAQSEELRVTNEELEEQGAALRETQARLELQQVELEQTNSQLEEQAHTLEMQRDELAKTSDTLELRARELQQASQYKSDFLANMSHELRTPLNSLLILSKLLGDNPDENLTAEQVKFARTIESSGNDLLSLINDILDLSKIEAGHIEIQPAPVAIDRIVADVRKTFQPIADQRGLALTIDVASDAPRSIETDRMRLEQVLKNLLSNALKFTEQGSVRLSIAPAGDRIELAVTDTGIGISAEHQASIFEAFQQADGTISRRYGGTGLGLSISRELARLLGGSIRLTSTPGHGSCFTLSIPAVYDPASVAGIEAGGRPGPAAAPPPRKTAPAARTAPVQPGGRIDDDRDRLDADKRLLLVIEDDPTFAAILCDMSRERGFQCAIADTAEEALEIARELKPHAIVLDIGLPDQSGLTVLDRLKHQDETRHIPIHVISGSDQGQNALALGAIGYLEKPARREQLVDVLAALQDKLTARMRRVLIVEDNAVQRAAVSELLKSQDVEPVGVGTAAECINRLRSESYDCMVLDLSLPDASGFALLETLSGDDSISYPPVIVYTGRDLTADEEQRLRRYSSSIIIKGAKSPERLLDEVSLFLHRVVADLPPEQRRMIEKARHRDAALEGRRVLIVEDDVRNIYSLTSVLEPRGVVTSIARNGQEALDFLNTEEGARIDLVLMDVMMPVMDGLAAVREIRARPEWRKLPVIMLTAKAMPDDQQNCLDAGANDYMAKPIDVDKLLSLVRVWMPR